MYFEASGKAAFTTQQIINTTCYLACDAGVFSDECKACPKLEPTNKKWAEFQRIFTEAHQDLHEPRTTSRSRVHTNYASQDSSEIEAITQLANATTADRTTMTTLTSQVQHL